MAAGRRNDARRRRERCSDDGHGHGRNDNDNDNDKETPGLIRIAADGPVQPAESTP
ncbi:hypothetical protein AvCA_17580 [Azotobacter vinelandii CA]|uniref:Uncharacterized protein n=2 Tax=Azotobacter vinelandii TaxID=354 RepID=C1DDK0_AZOVD|nr:hypothetical protein Avin_17580 [Azotobacter vinelandii DJ]AGK16911.1 hypothetical protein AvCA_17580 [Azotobacter vinelandii CA]AGK20135.1 hypothetical protein AvCA6_17580 [Azotobacter vinelandii CA6]